jgi:hypothetical protein
MIDGTAGRVAGPMSARVGWGRGEWGIGSWFNRNRHFFQTDTIFLPATTAGVRWEDGANDRTERETGISIAGGGT